MVLVADTGVCGYDACEGIAVGEKAGVKDELAGMC